MEEDKYTMYVVKKDLYLDDNSYNHSDSNEMDREREDEEQEQYLTEWRKNHCTRTKKDTAIRQQAKPSRMQAGFHTM